MKTIVVSVTNDLVIDQRVHKVCTTLKEMGFNIHLIGRKLKNSLPIHRDYKTTRIKLLFNKGPLFYAEYNFRLFWLLLFTKKDVFLSNDLDTLLSNFLASKICNKPIVYDSHELYTEVPELIHRPTVQKIWLGIESFIFPKLKDVFVVSNSIANYYAKKYNIKVNVLKNVPCLGVENIEKPPNDILRFVKGKQAVIYQGAVNIGRGINLMIDAVLLLENTVLCIVGDGDISDEIINRVEREGLKDKIFFYGKVPSEILKKITPVFNLGFSLEEDLGLNYRYALPNKIFDYVNAEIPCLVSNLPEMKWVVEEYKIGEVINDRSADKIAIIIKEILNKKESYLLSIKKAKIDLNWEKESEVIKQVYSKFL
ncbi:hypothetical protein AXE80_00105 [Wenyingzhuangia fucanilytica]|uniref:Glycosyltransferase n=1 Tax=Wenyingzhuangia fucanilytica TaxID=1790137 RepID=A0A1B1Y213_9FLAO|nr:glycosyltransferase [Wenyingzhuangia fucanilytica]ANW94789.1 hypothetical protein AXE80_00105 [Wenyingzhuangia fucanilytica]